MIRAFVQLRFAGVDVGLTDIVGMIIRGTLKREMVDALTVVGVTRLPISPLMLEAHLLAGGRPDQVVRAALGLQQVDADVAPEFLAALDLDGVDVVALAHACAEGRASDRQLRFEEVVQRHRSGEDVIGKAERGTLRSTFHQQGWRVRIEYGPVDLEQIRTLIDRAPAGAVVELARPGEASWEPLKRFRASGVL